MTSKMCISRESPGSLGFVAVGPEDCQHAEVLVLGDVAAGIDYVAGLQKLQV